MHAQEIGTEIDNQAKIVKKVNKKAEAAREGLEKKNSDLKNLLDGYRRQNKWWKDILLLIILMVLIGINVKAMQWKGWLPS
jgi:t-SNARE complex subunit (syntaxin)